MAATQLWQKGADGLWHCPGRSPLDAFVMDVTQPTASNTGVIDGRTLTDHAGDMVITTDGAVVEGLRIHGLVDIQANNVTFRFNEVVSRTITTFPGYDALVRSSGTNNYIGFNHLTQYDPSTSTDNSIYYVVGVKLIGGSALVERNNIHDTNDLVYITAGVHEVRGNYAHDPGFRTDDADQASDPTHPNWSHNDGCQIRGGGPHLIHGNNFEMKFSTLTGMNSTANPSPTAEQVWPNCHGILLENAVSVVSATLSKNWFKYGACGIHFTSSTSGGVVTVSGNRITPDQSKEFSVYTQIRIDPTTSWTVTDDGTNVYSNDSDTPLAWQGVALKAPTTSGTTKVWQFNSGAHTP